MVLELVKEAIHIKLTCKSESPIISPAEFCFAAGYALKLIESQTDFAQEVRLKTTINEMKMLITAPLNKVQEQYKEDPQASRLVRLLLTCKVEGEVSEELRKLFDMGFA